jgi:hypothetical protein
VRINEHLAAIPRPSARSAHRPPHVRDLVPAIADDVEPALRRVLATGAPLAATSSSSASRAPTRARAGSGWRSTTRSRGAMARWWG